MKKKYDIIFLTNQPSFYKVNLYNEVAKKKHIFVIFTNHLNSGRTKDFTSVKCHFDNITLNQRSNIKKTIGLVKIVNNVNYKELILGGWDNIPTWVIAFVKNKHKNSCVSESSYHESITDGIKGLLKRIFLSRISRAYVSGRAQKKVFENLNFDGEYIITKGVGVFNYISQPAFKAKKEVKKFIYVGRLIPEKNLPFLIDFFNDHSELELNIVGFGKQEEFLQSMASNNIKFLGAIPNKDLSSIYQQMDVFILPSRSEPWGLVVEEALNNGLPVLVSNKVGCAEEIVNEDNGLIFEYNSKESLAKAVSEIRDISRYNEMRLSISKMDFAKIEEYQVKQYIH